MAVIFRSLNGTFTTLNSAPVSTDAAESWFVADSFSFGVEREMKVEEGESSASAFDQGTPASRTYVTLLSDQTGLNPSNDASGDAFDFTTTEASEGVGKPNPGKMNFEHYYDKSSTFDGDGIDDLATDQPDSAVIRPGESFTYTLDPREVGAIIMEYAVML